MDHALWTKAWSCWNRKVFCKLCICIKVLIVMRVLLTMLCVKARNIKSYSNILTYYIYSNHIVRRQSKETNTAEQKNIICCLQTHTRKSYKRTPIKVTRNNTSYCILFHIGMQTLAFATFCLVYIITNF